MAILRKLNCWIALFFVSILFVQCQKNPDSKTTSIVSDILNNKKSFFYIDTENYPKQDKTLPIGVFDSGTGGLTVLDAIVQFDQFDNNTKAWRHGGDGIKDFRKEYFIYLGDQANMPYGNYNGENKTDLLKEHIIKDVQFLLGNKYYRSGDEPTFQDDKRHVKAIVIACNTATAYGKKDIEAFMDLSGLDMKVIGVIDAGVRSALDLFQKKEDGCIAIMATAGTVASEGYVQTLDLMKERSNYTGNITAFQQAGIGLAGAIDGSYAYIAPNADTPRSDYKGPSENHPAAKIDLSILKRYGFRWDDNEMLFEGDMEAPGNIQLNSVDNYISYHLVSLLEKIRKAHSANKLKAIILGCTHYPFYTNILQNKLKELYDYQEKGEFIYRPYMAKHIDWIDPALNTAKELYDYLAECTLFNDRHHHLSEFYISVPNLLNKQVGIDASAMFSYDYKYGRDAGIIQEYVKRVPFSKKTISPEVIQRLSNKIPLVFDLISHFNHSNPKTDFLQAEIKINILK